MTGLEQQLFDSIERKDTELIKKLIEWGVDVNCIDYSGYSPLYFSLASKRVKNSHILIEAGADPTFIYCDQTHNCLFYILNFINQQIDITNSVAILIKPWYADYDNQKKMILNYPSIIKTFIDNDFLNEKLKEEFKELITANDLNLL